MNEVHLTDRARPGGIGHHLASNVEVAACPPGTLHSLLDELGSLHARLMSAQGRLDDTVQRITGSAPVVEGPTPVKGAPAPTLGQVPMAVDMTHALHLRLNRLEDAIMRLENLT